MTGLVHYPFPLRPGLWVYLRLPADLTRADVVQIVRLLETLVVEEPPEPPSPAEPPR